MNRRPVVLAYTPSNTDREVLKRIFVQRERLLEKIVDRLARSMLTDDKHHILLIGPRGSGKTHLVALAEYELRRRNELSDAMRVAWLGEDDTFTGLIDIALGIAGQLAAEYPDEFDTDYRTPVRGLDPQDAAEAILKSVIARLGKRSILLIMENLDRVFGGLGDLGQKKWRAFLQEQPRIATLATSQQLFDAVASRDEAFFGFFDIQHLTPLAVDDARELIRKISLEQKKGDLVAYLDSAEGRYRIRALHHLAGGNHRMYVLLAEFLTKKSLDDLVEAFEDLAEELTPYFQERVRSLAPQQARIVQCLCNANGAMTVKEVSEESFIAEGNCSKQLGNLKQRGYVQSQKRGKESFYEMAEPLMRLCLELKNQRGRPLRLVAKFLRAWFPESRLRKTPLSAFGTSRRGDAYRVAALETDTGIEEFLRTNLNDEIRKSISKRQFDRALELSSELKFVDPSSASLISAEILARCGDFEGCVVPLSQVIDMVEASTSQKAIAHFNRGVTFERRGDMERAFADFTAVIDTVDASAQLKAIAFVNRGRIYEQRRDKERALADFTSIIDMADAPAEQKATAFFYRGMILGQRGDVDQELAHYTTVIDMADAPAKLKATALFNRGMTLGQRGDLERALADYTAVIDLADAPAKQKAKALVNRGVTLGQRGDLERALADYTAVIDLADAPAEQRAQALVIRSVTLGQRGDLERALADCTSVINLADAPAEQKARALLCRGMILGQRGDADQELADYTAVIDLADAPAELKAQALVNRGVTLGERGYVERALADCTAVIDIPDAPMETRSKALYNLGAMQWQSGHYRSAQQSFERLFAIPGLSSEWRTAASFALPEAMVAGASRDQVIAALEAAFRDGDKATEEYGGTPQDLLAMVLRRGHQEWDGYVAALVPLYVNYKAATKLGQGVTQTIELLGTGGYSESQLDAWNGAWQKSGQGCEELEIPLQTLDAAVEAIKSRSDRPLFRLPLEIRELVRPLLAKSLSE